MQGGAVRLKRTASLNAWRPGGTVNWGRVGSLQDCTLSGQRRAGEQGELAVDR